MLISNAALGNRYKEGSLTVTHIAKHDPNALANRDLRKILRFNIAEYDRPFVDPYVGDTVRRFCAVGYAAGVDFAHA
jgi:hypothetical protein